MVLLLCLRSWTRDWKGMGLGRLRRLRKDRPHRCCPSLRRHREGLPMRVDKGPAPHRSEHYAARQQFYTDAQDQLGDWAPLGACLAAVDDIGPCPPYSHRPCGCG